MFQVSRAWVAGFCVVGLCLGALNPVRAEVKAAADGGFALEFTRNCDGSPEEAYKIATRGVSAWWNPDHTYSGDARWLRMDMQRREFLEVLPGGGFAQHMRIAIHQPGKRLVLLGGLGPLQGMGVHGAMTFRFAEQKNEAGQVRTEIQIQYNVSGYSPDGLKPLAPAVDKVLSEQFDRLAKYCDQQAKR